MASTLKASPVPGKSPLSGLRVLVGRARAQASALSSGLKALGAEVVEIPFIEVRRPRSYQPLDAALKNLIRYDWLVFTSVNGVEAVAERMKKCGLTKKNLRHLRVAAIGPATQQAIERLGIEVHVVPEQYVAESVVESLRAAGAREARAAGSGQSGARRDSPRTAPTGRASGGRRGLPDRDSFGIPRPPAALFSRTRSAART